MSGMSGVAVAIGIIFLVIGALLVLWGFVGR